MLKTLAVWNYRSLRGVVVSLGRVTVATGPNGSGKSNLYRALRLLAAAGKGEIVGQLAREGGLPSTLWAGPETIGSAMRSGRHPVQGTVRKHPIGLKLGFAGEDFGYSIELGLPPKSDGPPSGFELDPEIKRECIWAGEIFRPAKLLVDRQGPRLRTLDDTGRWQVAPDPLPTFESMMTEYVDPRTAPVMVTMRARLRSWRFYDHFRSDFDAPARRPQIGTHTPVLADDGADLAAALQTIRTIGDAAGLDEAIDDAFSGSRIEILSNAAQFELQLRQTRMLRPLGVAELSDGTLRYLLLTAALLSPRPPELLVLNEPETSLHPDLVPALARLIGRAAETAQIIVVTHSDALLAHLNETDPIRIQLDKELGETTTGDGLLAQPAWSWPPR